MSERLVARAAASGPPVEPLTKRAKRPSRPSRAPGSFRTGDMAADIARSGSEAGPNQPR